MRITRGQLQDLINEEISNALLERQNRRLLEAHDDDDGHGGLYDLDSAELLDFAKGFASLGAAVQEQLEDLLAYQEEASCNENAVQMIQDRLGGMNHEIDVAIEAWLGKPAEDDEDEDDGTWAAAVRMNR